MGKLKPEQEYFLCPEVMMMKFDAVVYGNNSWFS
jgi:hypothetical protein